MFCRNFHLVIFAFCLLSLFVVAGCRNTRLKGLVPVDGEVRYLGKPLPGAIVAFEPASGQGMAASCYTDKNGRFTLTTRHSGDGVFPGDYCVSIDKVTVLFMPTPEEAEEHQRKTGRALEPEYTIDVPRKYRTASTSEISYTITKKGLRNIVIELTD